MLIHIENAWLLFTITFGLMLIATLIMGALGKQLFTKDVLVRPFSILDLEFAATGQEIVNIIRGIYDLPAEQTNKVVKALRAQLFVDFFLFMPAVYGGIFILCMKVSEKMGPFGQWLFPTLAWLQVIAFILDAIENIYFLNTIKRDPVMPTPARHKAFQRMEIAKWGLALFAAICAFSAILYYWVSGHYTRGSIPYLATIALEVVVFGIIVKVASKKEAEEEKNIQNN